MMRQGCHLVDLDAAAAGRRLGGLGAEQRETVTRMLMHARGFAKVRGWEFTRCDALIASECETIRRTILFRMGALCRKYGGRGHLQPGHRCMRPREAWLETLDQRDGGLGAVVVAVRGTRRQGVVE